MAISGIGSNYNNVYEGTYAAQKGETANQTETKEAASVQAGKAQNTGEKAVSDYYSYLQKNYDCMSNGNVMISGGYLKECAGDSGKAKELEDFLKKIPELEKQGYEQLSAQNKAMGGTVTYYHQTWMFNKDGSIQSTVYSVTETGMTNAEKMKKNMDERLEKQKEKKEEAEKAERAKEKKAVQEEKQNGDERTSEVVMAEGIRIEYVKANSEEEAVTMQNRERESAKDAYRQSVNLSA